MLSLYRDDADADLDLITHILVGLAFLINSELCTLVVL
jgi:hypothetical protein